MFVLLHRMRSAYRAWIKLSSIGLNHRVLRGSAVGMENLHSYCVVVVLAMLMHSHVYGTAACDTSMRRPELLSPLAIGQSVTLPMFEGRAGFDAWTSSSLAPSAARPKRPSKQASDEASMQAQEAYADAVAEWSCMYTPYRMHDGDKNTAWCEAGEGVGVGQAVFALVDSSGPVRIWAGYGKSPRHHAANARPKKVRVAVIDAPQISPASMSEAWGYEPSHRLVVAAVHEVVLRDFNGYQVLKLPPHEEKTQTLIALQILSSYPGGQYQDACISAVEPQVALP